MFDTGGGIAPACDRTEAQAWAWGVNGGKAQHRVSQTRRRSTVGGLIWPGINHMEEHTEVKQTLHGFDETFLVASGLFPSRGVTVMSECLFKLKLSLNVRWPIHN